MRRERLDLRHCWSLAAVSSLEERHRHPACGGDLSQQTPTTEGNNVLRTFGPTRVLQEFGGLQPKWVQQLSQPNFSDSALVALLAADLVAANYTVDGLNTLFGADAAAALDRGQRVPALRVIGQTPLGTLARVFMLGLAADRDDLDVALARLGAAGAVQLRLIDALGNPLVDLRPYSVVDSAGVANWWIASDLGEVALGHELGLDHVLGVGGASTTLSSLIVPTEVDLALDLGTGCGIQALHAARFAAKVIATDISERALSFARFNSSLNGVTNIEFRIGNLFEPVTGLRFDLIVSNPPFVITPRGSSIPEYEYRAGGMVGDGIVSAVIAGLELALAPGGIAQLLGNWEYTETDGLERVRGWLSSTGLDAWAVERERQNVDLYAETWIRDGGTKPGARFDLLYSAWLDDFRSRGVTEVGFGYLTLRSPTAGRPTLRRIERYGHPLGGSLGRHTASVLAAHDWLERRDDAGLTQSRLSVASDVTEERHYWPGDEHPSAITLRQGGGFARSFPVGTALAAVVGACDGTLSLAAIVGAVAQLLEVDEVAMLAEILPEVRELIETGMLLVESTAFTGRAHVPPT